MGHYLNGTLFHRVLPWKKIFSKNFSKILFSMIKVSIGNSIRPIFTWKLSFRWKKFLTRMFPLNVPFKSVPFTFLKVSNLSDFYCISKAETTRNTRLNLNGKHATMALCRRTRARSRALARTRARSRKNKKIIFDFFKNQKIVIFSPFWLENRLFQPTFRP